ncbi:MAG: thioredoxin-disulfide reductase [Alphaproteobacteria bacterium RIFCSPLOWO2_01_FULL_40_26]|nr:MAG: thioredoxin-disulfide reductase [Alphaproteobacteria bacterium RIFCSPHIGHO2_02_FULL_40_34]OFW95326.1 MAG: thioredoxin-disulfide reductase [Alphaproteobacteria bacterium RIFCSPLOWO2_01_FULL_40_26]OFX09229.1 MAG: thioredoxin-disulfide reductase [Alphaproteobacteria bacterium RIFCSPLOWO2_02_FULL_40_19]OFX11584.1 MAG: thioredoxin-disulfide reductase [Alphaproteobacteria bacterium RIFCSPLOWO2_12_FULL_40_11]
MTIHKTKVAIIGSGPAGFTAAIYAARANLAPIIINGIQPGGQLTITTDVENYPGFAEVIQGPWLMEQMQKQAEHVGTKIFHDHIKEVDFSRNPFKLIGESDDVYEADAVVIATGAQAKWLGLESEKKYQGFGVSGCATCDGFFFRGKEVIVVGGGNSAVEEALYLTNHAKKVYVVHRRDKFKSEKILQDRLFKNPKIEVIWNHALDEVLGSDNPKSVTAARLKNTQNNAIHEMKIDGIFIAIGHKPNSDLFKNTGIEIDSEGYIKTKPNSTATNIPGVYAAGDIQDKIYRQAVTAAGTGCMAALEIEKFLAH